MIPALLRELVRQETARQQRCLGMEKSMMDRANEGKMFRIKQYRVWIGLLARRLWRQPVYVGLLLLVPLLGYVAGSMEREERSGAAVAICV
ncbi:MAG: hypothetical protein K2P66_06585, partial [Lachnospiraceae bacterium]|nr:hypothetical protein [Lachnospiraceae bacterium]